MHGMSATLARTRGFRPLISPSNILSHGNYQRLIPNYATVAQPLLTAKAYSNVVWTDEFTVTFELGMSRLIGTADKSADIWRFQNNR